MRSEVAKSYFEYVRRSDFDRAECIDEEELSTGEDVLIASVLDRSLLLFWRSGLMVFDVGFELSTVPVDDRGELAECRPDDPASRQRDCKKSLVPFKMSSNLVLGDFVSLIGSTRISTIAVGMPLSI
ncbi:hypothetical protein BELL_0530g00040 [Botrytis elliptica]|uniref:Uncharacterized protein n=1 Tax=Botrytis elliptica TaxID=278938 RepID=A0A4Z1JE28_9HELO|nr:hypothetical protein BELL_0530g00040 [Botrytis elliptica]